MDTLRGTFGSPDPEPETYSEEDEIVHEAPPPEIGGDERRMQVRAYNYWAGLLDNRNYPNVEDLDPQALPDFGPNGVLLDFSRGIEDPAVLFLGDRLAQECGANGLAIQQLSDVPARSLLSRITDHYMQILANQAPIGFEAEFVNQRGRTILYRGILLPFSSDDDTIDFIYGVINWKELAAAEAADELLLEIDQALDREEEPAPRRRMHDLPLSDWADGPGSLPANDIDPPADAPQPPVNSAEADLADRLAAARALALAAREREDRSRSALYDAISRAYDFALAAEAAPGEFARLLEEFELTVQDRAPMTPVVKLVFGADYDKTRLTEYATALNHARRLGLQQGALGDYLRAADGGLKGVVARERAHRREHSGDAAESGAGPAWVSRLRAIEPAGLAALASQGSEFGLVMIRRTGGEIVVLGEVPDNRSLVEKAARELIG